MRPNLQKPATTRCGHRLSAITDHQVTPYTAGVPIRYRVCVRSLAYLALNLDRDGPCRFTGAWKVREGLFGVNAASGRTQIGDSRPEVLATIIPPERHPRQPLADGCQRLLALGPFVARLPVDRELRIGRRAVRHDGTAGRRRPTASIGGEADGRPLRFGAGGVSTSPICGISAMRRASCFH